MDVLSREDRIRKKYDSKIQRITQKLEEIHIDDDLRLSLDAVDAEIDALEQELDALDHAEREVPGLRERIEAKRERLLARQERLRMKVDMRQEMQERLRESLSDVQAQLQETLEAVQSQGWDRHERDESWHRRPPTPPHPGMASRQLREERRKILEMVQQGTIGAEDAAQLLDALRDQEENARRPHRRPRWVRIRVTDMDSDKVRVNLTLPVGLVRAGLRAGGSIAGVAGLDTAGLEEMLDRGEMGHILDVQDSDDGERVEIFVE